MRLSPASAVVSFRTARGSGRRVTRSGADGSARAVMLAVIVGAALLARGAALAGHRRPRANAPAAAEKSNRLDQPYAEALLLEPETGTVMFDKNSHQPWPTASLAKMMIAFIVAQKLQDGSLKPSDRVTTSAKAAKMGGSQVYLKEGETFSLDDMMKAIMVHSANDASVAVAEYIGGSTDAFVEMMNRQAARLGMKDTHYYSVHGLPPGPGQQADVSSAWDEALLARALIRYPQVLKWSEIDTAPFRDGSFELRNTNHLVRTFPGCDGLKTGFYYAAGFNVVATAHRGGMRLIAVVLGSPRKGENFKSASELLAQGFASYEMRAVGKRGAPIAQAVAVNDGVLASFKPVWGEDLSVLLKRGGDGAVKVQFQLPAALPAPVRAGQQIGAGQAVSGDKVVASAPLVAPAAIASRPSLLERLRHVF
jgi:D-alanyl-D-alanine carboxypeptidase (penicillin-binding protein 5/6)